MVEPAKNDKTDANGRLRSYWSRLARRGGRRAFEPATGYHHMNLFALALWPPRPLRPP
jgi:hypothetical protein